MLVFIVTRLASTLPVLLGLSLAVFVMLRVAPGDPVALMLGQDADAATIAQLRASLGIDQPVPVQYVRWLGGIMQGDLGRSLRSHQPVFELVFSRMPVTLELAILAQLVALAVGIPLGTLAALRPNSAVDIVSQIASQLGLVVPNFFLGLLFILVFSVWLGALPPSGYVPLIQDPIQNFRMMVMPACALGLALAASISRMMRSSLLEALYADFVRAARAKGLNARAVVLGHATPNALLPVVTIVGLQVGSLVGGAVLIETVFALPGLGRLVVDSIFARDLPVVQGAVLLLGLLRVVCTLGVDITHARLDPRISRQ